MCVYVVTPPGNVCDNHIQARFSSIRVEADNAGWRTHWGVFAYCLRSEEEALKLTTTTGRWEKQVNTWCETRQWPNTLYITFGGNDKGTYRLAFPVNPHLIMQQVGQSNETISYYTAQFLVYVASAPKNFRVFWHRKFRKNYKLIESKLV